jgi:hypothetical protein
MYIDLQDLLNMTDKHLVFGFLFFIVLITGCMEDSGQVGPQPSGQIILERVADGRELDRWDMDKAFLEQVYSSLAQGTWLYELNLFSVHTDITINDNELDDDAVEGDGLRMIFDFRNLFPEPLLLPNDETCGGYDPYLYDYPEDFSVQYTVSRGTMDPDTGMPLGDIVTEDVETRTYERGVRTDREGIHYSNVLHDDYYCLREDKRLTIAQSSINPNWFRIDLFFTVPNSDNVIRGYYEGPVNLLESESEDEDTFPLADGEVQTICGRTEGDADGIPGALSYGNLDFFLSRTGSSIFIADFGNNVVRSFDETNGVNTISETFVGPASIVSLPFEAFEDLYVAETRDKQLRKINGLTGITEGVLIRDPGGNSLEGNATWYESLAINQDPSLLQRTIYALTDGVDQTYGNRIMKIDVRESSATQTLYAGNGISRADEVLNGPATIATFNFPEDLAVDYQNNVYVADGHSIRKIDAQTTNVTTLAGLDENGNYLGMPSDYEVNNVFDLGGNRVFRGFTSVAYDAFNDRIIATHINNEIWAFSEVNGELQSQLIKRAAFGSDDGSLEEATFSRPNNVQVDPENGDIYLADGAQIRRIRQQP